MSEPRIISPLLDGYALGHSMSCHSGVYCYPAMRVDSDERYIVKSISVPASQTQLEALLLTGAYPNAEAARAYFKELVQSIREEVEVLDKLAAQRGFLPYLKYQIAPMEDGVGFDFYLISQYRRTLGRFLKRSAMTHLSAVNMGIDLCAALAICREAGYLYVDLKPSNIFLSGEQEYHIGDLGFVRLDSLQYASLPDRYRSNWIPPEISDAYSTMNTTMDTYALGLVLYQVYNDGKLPFDSEESRAELMARLAEGEAMPAPVYADQEMAQIILKACAYNPEDRWQSPAQMGHALIAYMQRNDVNNVPIDSVVEEESEEIPEQEPAEENESPEESAEEAEETAEEEAAAGEALPVEELPEREESGEPEEYAGEDNWIDRMDAILSEDGEEDDEDAAALRQILSDDETLLGEDDGELDPDAICEDTADILSQADELIAHEAPEPVVAPEAIDVPIPAPLVTEEDEPSEEEPEEDFPEEEIDQSDDIDDEDLLGDDHDVDYHRKPRRAKKIIGWLIAILILALLGCGAFYYYNEYYLQPVTALTAAGEGDQLTVSVSTELDNSLLTVVCVDQYGKKFTSPLADGVATFTGLDPDTQYTITLEVDGFYQLTGITTTQYYTLPQANVTSFTAVTGAEDGTVILNFTAEGPPVESWTLNYGPTGQAPTGIAFTGSTITIPALTLGQEYTFTLVAPEDVELVGQTQITHVATNVIYAENLTLTGQDGSLTATWTTPEGVTVGQWNARCYNETGYDQTLPVTENTATFTGIDTASSYTVEIIAEGMTAGTRTYVTANPITVTAVNPQITETGALKVTWEFTGTAPEGGWLLLYTVDNGGEQRVVQCAEPSAVIEPLAPGSHYDLTIQAANSASVFGGISSIDVPQTDAFAQFNLTAEQVSATMCKAPEAETWTYKDVADEAKTAIFTVGEAAAVLLQTDAKPAKDDATVVTVYVIRDAEGKLAAISSTSAEWNAMWKDGHCDLKVPQLPSVAGSYTLDIYMAGQKLTSQAITIE